MEQNLNNSTTTAKPKPGAAGNGSNKRRAEYSRFFRHWRSGVIYDARDYGHKAWPLGAKGR